MSSTFTNFANEMSFPIHINIVDLVFKGMLIGMIASAPMGPVGILCVQRTLNKGRIYGLATGIGAAISDIIKKNQTLFISVYFIISQLLP